MNSVSKVIAKGRAINKQASVFIEQLRNDLQGAKPGNQLNTEIRFSPSPYFKRDLKYISCMDASGRIRLAAFTKEKDNNDAVRSTT